ncbi:MAG: hypothetical protein AAF442_03060 [Pseudomonadota bacterium]
MTIKSVRARVWHWQGPTLPPQTNFLTNAGDMLGPIQDPMTCFDCHQSLICEVITRDDIKGFGLCLRDKHLEHFDIQE